MTLGTNHGGYVQIKAVQVFYGTHAHDFTYSADGDTITATCGAEGCTLDDGQGNHTATLTIGAPTSGSDATITVSPAGALTGYTVTYQSKSGGTWGAETTTAPTAAGIHRATVTLGGETVSVSYGNNCITYASGLEHGSISGSTGATCGATVTPTITPDEGYQLDTLTVTPEEGSGVTSVEMTADGTGFVMPEANVTVSATFKEITYAVEVDGGKATVTDSLPEQNTWTAELVNMPADKTYDGESVDLTAVAVQKGDGFPDNKVTVGEVSIKDENDNTVTTAKSVGTYTASATVGDKTISKSFSIHGQTPPVTYVESTERVGNSYLVTKVTTDQYIPLENNPNGITLLKDGETYVASGNIEIGALVYTGEVNLVLCKNTTVTVYAGIYHIGSKLNIYVEEGAESSELIVKGNKALSALDNYADFNGQTVLDENAALSGTIQVYGGKLTLEKGNSNLVSDDVSLTLSANLSADGLTGGTENADGSTTYGKAAFANLASLAVKSVAVVTAAPTANSLTYNGRAQELVTAGEAEGGTMQYALGENDTTAPTDSTFSASVPKATEAGTYFVWYKVVGDDNHNDAKPACVKATVAKADIAKAKVTLKKTSYTYDGNAKEPGVKSVTLGGRTLKAGRDYAVSYKANVKLGTATCTVTGKGNYRGSAKATFTIALAKAKISTVGSTATSGFSASWAKVLGAKSYQLQWRKAGGKWKAASVKGTSKLVTGLTAGDLYQFRVRAVAGDAKGAWSKVSGRYMRSVKGVKATVKKAGTVTASWQADPEADLGYVVVVRYSKDGAVIAKASVAAGTTEATVKGLEAGQRYWVQVRPARESGGTTFSGVLRGTWAK